MTKTITDWEKLGQIYSSAERVREHLEEKGFEALVTLNIGVFPAMLNIIVKRNNITVFSECVLDALKEEEKLDKIFNECMELLNTDELEKMALRKRLAELEGYGE